MDCNDGRCEMQLVDWRKQHGFTQADVAEALGVIVVTVSRWECGMRTPATRFQRAILDMTLGAVAPNDWVR